MSLVEPIVVQFLCQEGHLTSRSHPYRAANWLNRHNVGLSTRVQFTHGPTEEYIDECGVYPLREEQMLEQLRNADWLVFCAGNYERYEDLLDKVNKGTAALLNDRPAPKLVRLMDVWGTEGYSKLAEMLETSDED